MALFAGCQIVLDLSTSIKFKAKSQLRKDVTSHGGVVSFIVTKKSTHIVCDDAKKAVDSYKCQIGLKYGVPVVSTDWVTACIESGKLQNTDQYLLLGQSKSEELKEGKISATKYQQKDKKKESKLFVNVATIKVWKAKDKNMPSFADDFQVAKFAIFEGKTLSKKNKVQIMDKNFSVLEVHVDDSFKGNNSDSEYKYRVTSHFGTIQEVEKGGSAEFEMRFCHRVEEALAVYSSLYNDQKVKRMTLTHKVISRHIGSEKFRHMMSEFGLETGQMSQEVGHLVEHVWKEALGELKSVLAVDVYSLKSEQIDKAEASLKQVKSALEENDSTQLQKHLSDYYNTLAHLTRQPANMINKAWLSKEQDLCQLVKDMISVSEATDWSTTSSTQSKYRALRCEVACLPATSPEFQNVKEKVLQSLENGVEIMVQAIYAVNRPVETTSFTHHLENKRQLYHASKADNLVGILSRGLLMPKVVVDDHGGQRSDPGMLGSGLYFASAASTSVGYSLPSHSKGTRFMLVNEVALGNCKDMCIRDLTLNSPPEGYDSVHGMKTSADMPSEFKADEYVVYNPNQQRMRYLVEFTTPKDTVKKLVLEKYEVIETQEDEEVEKESEEISLKDVKDIADPMSKVKAGLVSKDDAPVNLKAVHVRAKLMDLASEVVVLQQYENTSKVHIEAKYVFPLGDMAAVCGFEAFINGKHIVGEVKEKETAHREYKKAISEGHGAYLMDQDEETPDVFTVSVGNLPPGATVLIKITYVSELQVEGELISFRLPGSVAPWKKESLKEVTQHETDTVEVQQGETSVQVSVEMPFDIRSVECPTQKVKIKRTLTKATVEMLSDQSIADGFQLLIGLAEIHVPRMWVERKPGNQDHQACMVTFYPQFEACESESVSVTFLLDLSNSMKGDNLRNAKKVMLLTLQHLPPNWNFNIVVFGTAFKELFPTCVPRSTANVKLAQEFVMGLSATLGNTEVVRPMHTFYLLKPESSIQNVFLISDGHVNNSDILLEKARLNCQHTRTFTMGVSSTADRHLLRALARVGAGAFEFFDPKVKSKWERKVQSHINKAAQPGLTSVMVDWEQHGTDVAPPVLAPRQITAIFSGSRQVIYGFVPNCSMATLKAEVAGYEVSTMVSTSDLSITDGNILHRLTARAIISDWEDGVLSPDKTDHEIAKMNMKNYIIELSKEYSIVTQFTSFVAIEKRDKDDEKSIMDSAPSMAELVDNENVDQLKYMGFEELQPEVDLDKAIEEVLTNVRLHYDSKEKQKEFLKDFLKLQGKEDINSDDDELNEKVEKLAETCDELGLFEDYECDLYEEYDSETEFGRRRIGEDTSKEREQHSRFMDIREDSLYNSMTGLGVQEQTYSTSTTSGKDLQRRFEDMALDGGHDHTGERKHLLEVSEYEALPYIYKMAAEDHQRLRFEDMALDGVLDHTGERRRLLEVSAEEYDEYEALPDIYKMAAEEYEAPSPDVYEMAAEEYEAPSPDVYEMAAEEEENCFPLAMTYAVRRTEEKSLEYGMHVDLMDDILCAEPKSDFEGDEEPHVLADPGKHVDLMDDILCAEPKSDFEGDEGGGGGGGDALQFDLLEDLDEKSFTKDLKYVHEREKAGLLDMPEKAKEGEKKQKKKVDVYKSKPVPQHEPKPQVSQVSWRKCASPKLFATRASRGDESIVSRSSEPNEPMSYYRMSKPIPSHMATRVYNTQEDVQERDSPAFSPAYSPESPSFKPTAMSDIMFDHRPDVTRDGMPYDQTSLLTSLKSAGFGSPVAGRMFEKESLPAEEITLLAAPPVQAIQARFQYAPPAPPLPERRTPCGSSLFSSGDEQNLIAPPRPPTLSAGGSFPTKAETNLIAPPLPPRMLLGTGVIGTSKSPTADPFADFETALQLGPPRASFGAPAPSQAPTPQAQIASSTPIPAELFGGFVPTLQPHSQPPPPPPAPQAKQLAQPPPPPAQPAPSQLQQSFWAAAPPPAPLQLQQSFRAAAPPPPPTPLQLQQSSRTMPPPSAAQAKQLSKPLPPPPAQPGLASEQKETGIPQEYTKVLRKYSGSRGITSLVDSKVMSAPPVGRREMHLRQARFAEDVPMSSGKSLKKVEVPVPQGSLHFQLEAIPRFRSSLCQSQRMGTLSAPESELLLLDVTPLSIGVEVEGGMMYVIIPRNSTIPTRKHAMLHGPSGTDLGADCRGVAINVYEGERALVKYNHKMGEMELFDGNLIDVKITIEIDANSIITVTAKATLTGKSSSLTISNDKGRLSQQEISKMIGEADINCKADDVIRQHAENNLPVIKRHSVELCTFTPNLAGYGIGVQVSTCAVEEATMDPNCVLEISKLMNNEGYFDFSPTLGKLLGVDFQKCEGILTKAGLSSLGSKAQCEILRLLATSIVIIRLLKNVLPDIDPEKMTEDLWFKKTEAIVSSGGTAAVVLNLIKDYLPKAFSYATETADKYPLVPSTLELGSSWTNVATRLLGM